MTAGAGFGSHSVRQGGFARGSRGGALGPATDGALAREFCRSSSLVLGHRGRSKIRTSAFACPWPPPHFDQRSRG